MKNSLKKYIILFSVILLINNTSFAEDELIMKSDWKNAYIKYSSLIKETPSAENNLNLCKITFNLNDKEAAKKYCKISLNEIEKEKNPDYELKSEILAMTGNIYSTVYHNNDITFDYYNQAKEYKEKNQETDKYDLAKLYLNIARTYDHTGRYDLSLTYWEKALKITDEEEGKQFNNIKAQIYRDKAKHELNNEKFEKYKEFSEKALSYALDTEEYINHALCGEIYNEIANYYDIKKNKTKAAENHKKALSEYSKFPDANLIEEENIPDENITIEQIKQKLSVYPYDVDLNVMAGSYYILENSDLAEKYFKKATSVNPVNAYVYAAIAVAYAEKYNEINIKDYKIAAKKYASEAEKYASDEPDIYLTLGLANIKMFELAAANSYFNSYIQNKGNKYDSYCEIAALIWYNDTKMQYRNQVIKYLEKAKAINELNSIYKLMLASAYKHEGKQKEANNTAADFLKGESK